MQSVTPVAGKDYPRTFQEFDRVFATEQACRDFLFQLRWREGFRCPRCESAETPWKTSRGWFHCRRCQKDVSLTAGTIFQDSRKPLRTWFLVMWFVTSQKHGASALGLQRVLGFGSYETAWTWLHKLRRAMVRPDREMLSERVEVDETFVGGVAPGKGGRHVGNKALVAVAAEVRGAGIGRIRLRRIPDSTSGSVLPFVEHTVAQGTTVVTDGLQSYSCLNLLGYTHERKVVLGSGQHADKLLPGVHRVAALLKRWLLGTHQGAVDREHLDYYLDEFTFRFNRRTSKARGLLFYRLAELAVCTPPAPYTALLSTAIATRRAEVST